jgi:hypothetical protein
MPGEYRESITPAAGTPGNYTIYSGYGNRSQIKILGSNEVTGWTNYVGNIWVANFSFPKNSRYEKINGVNTVTQNTTDCWEDRSGWYTRADYSGGSFLTSRGVSNITAPGMYYYNKTGHKLYLWTFDSESPSTHQIECSVRVTAPFMNSGEYPYDQEYWI